MNEPASLGRYQRFVALGDSQTEGLWDYHSNGGLRGWADRLAETIAVYNPHLLYANLAVRGRRAGAIRREQLEHAVAMKPDLAAVIAGVNDVTNPGSEIEKVVEEIEAMYLALRNLGSTVISCTFPLPSVGVARRLVPRLRALNATIRVAAARRGVVLVDLEAVPKAADLRLYCKDRVHLNPGGHARLAAAFESALSQDREQKWKDSLPDPLPSSRSRAAASEAIWLGRYIVPKLARLALGRSSGDGCQAKRPQLAPMRSETRSVRV